MKSAPIGESSFDHNDDAAGSNLSDVLWLFDALTSDKQESYMEEARRLLPPSLHHDKGSVLLTALQLMLNDEYLKSVKGVRLR
jgi:hypothetical protein